MATAVFARAGLVRPVSPLRAARIGAAALRFGASPAAMVAVSAIRWPDRTAIIDDAGTVTYRELEQRADTLALQLSDRHGIGPGRAVAVMCRNHRGLVEGIVAAGRLGADVLLVNTELPAHQLGLTLAGHRPAIILHDDEFADRLADAGTDAPMQTVWAGDGPAALENVLRGLGGSGHKRTRVKHPGKLILLTSGTTGAPKGVPRQPHASAFLGVATSSFQRLGLRTGDTMLVCPPAFHGMGLITLMLGLAAGDTVVLQRRFDAGRAAAAIEEHQVQVLIAVPAMLQRLLTVPDLSRKSRSLRAVLCGAAQLSPVVATQFMDVVGDVLYDGYGSSEIGIAALATPIDLREAPGTLGLPVLGTSVLILDADGVPVPAGVVGEIHIDSAMTFDGYTGGGHKNLRHGHISSGDLGHLDPRGRLFLDGRADDMIVSGGENVFPQPVETALLSHPSIADAAVIGVPDDEFGQRLRAFVVPADDTFDDETVREYLRTRLTRYEQPRDIVVVAELPRNATGKVLRRQLAANGPA